MLASATEFVRSEVRYGADLVEAGVNGIVSVWDAEQVLSPRSKTLVIATAAVGAGLGLARTLQRGPHRTRNVVASGLLGSAAGLGLALAWMSRAFTKDAARSASRTIRATRDAHWLERNPVAYG